MTLRQLTDRANEGYALGDPDDPLALFIVRELGATYDATATDDEQIALAMQAIRAGRRELNNVLAALSW